MAKKLIVSLSPHVHSTDSVQKNMYNVCIALLPALAASLWFFGAGAAIVLLTSVAACVFFEWAITKFLLKRERTTITDGSAILTGLLLGFNLPSNLPVWIIILGALVAIGIGKMTFGGLGCNPFNPALVGRVFMLISFPVQMTTWPANEAHLVTATVPETYKTVAATDSTDALSGATPLALMNIVTKNDQLASRSRAELAMWKDSVAAGVADAEKKVAELSATVVKAETERDRAQKDMPSWVELLVGQNAGSMGEVSAAALLLGLLYMLWRKTITWHIPVSIMASVVLFAGLLHLSNPQGYASPEMHLLTGGLLLGAIFMATDYVTSPMTPKGQIIYGVCIGLLTVVIRTFGAYPEGMSFAILIMNAFTPLINTYCKPKRFGEVVKK